MSNNFSKISNQRHHKMKLISRRANLHRNISLGITSTFAIGFTITLYKAIEWYNEIYNVPQMYALMVLAPLICGALYYRLHRKYIRRAKIYRTPFPTAWRQILNQNVIFYQFLPPASKERFEKMVHVFISEKKIVGVHVEIDDLIKVLVAASAVIPVFGYVDWEYDQLGTIFIYPNSFDSDFNFGNDAQRNISGMVTGEDKLNAMVLSKRDIIDSFVYSLNGRQVGVHEFVHLVDRGDGAIDGLLSLYWDKKQIREWRNLMYHEMTRIWNGETFIDPYATANPAEFLAVMSEYFFEMPELVANEHPEIYQLMKKGFRIDTQKLMKDAPQAQYYHDLKLRQAREQKMREEVEALRIRNEILLREQQQLQALGIIQPTDTLTDKLTDRISPIRDKEDINIPSKQLPAQPSVQSEKKYGLNTDGKNSSVGKTGQNIHQQIPRPAAQGQSANIISGQSPAEKVTVHPPIIVNHPDYQSQTPNLSEINSDIKDTGKPDASIPSINTTNNQNGNLKFIYVIK